MDNFDYNNDFGFSAIDMPEDKLIEESVSEIERLTKDNKSLARRLSGMRKEIDKLITNLEKNPEKEYIKWPNRDSAIARFREKLDEIEKGPY